MRGVHLPPVQGQVKAAPRTDKCCLSDVIEEGTPGRVVEHEGKYCRVEFWLEGGRVLQQLASSKEIVEVQEN